MSNLSLSPGDEWSEHYRGFTLRVSPNKNVWWQVYNGTDRLQLSPPPEDIAETLLEHKRIGGRIHVTEEGDVLTRLESDEDENGDEDEYTGIYIGSVDLSGDLVPEDDPEFSLPIRPKEISTGDLWPSVYDGSRYSFAGERVWWRDGSTHKRHQVSSGIPPEILDSLRRYKPSGGSFRITPWGDVITLVPTHPAPDDVAAQFRKLPRVVRNIIKLRKERNVEMLPIYVGRIDGASLTVSDPTSLTDSLSRKEQDELASWAGSLGRTTSRSSTAHKASEEQDRDSLDEATDNESSSTTSSANEETDPTEEYRFDDDPLDWIRDNIESSGSNR